MFENLKEHERISTGKCDAKRNMLESLAIHIQVVYSYGGRRRAQIRISEVLRYLLEVSICFSGTT